MNSFFQFFSLITLFSAIPALCVDSESPLPANEPVCKKTRSNESNSNSPRTLDQGIPAPSEQKKLEKQHAQFNLKEILNPQIKNTISRDKKSLSLESKDVQTLIFLNGFRTDLKSFVDNALLFRDNTQALWIFLYHLPELYISLIDNNTMTQTQKFGRADSKIQDHFREIYKKGLPSFFSDDRFQNLPLFFATNVLDALQTILIDVDYYTQTLGEKTLKTLGKLEKNMKKNILAGSLKRLEQFDAFFQEYKDGMIDLYAQHYATVDAAPNAQRDTPEIFTQNLTNSHAAITTYTKAVKKKLK